MLRPERVSVGWHDLADLNLDPDNPRHEPGMPRREIIRYLVANESVLGLARDIAQEGLSPLDLFGGMHDPEGGYLVLEGNRRLCALILLHDPSLAPVKERKAFDRLAQAFDPDALDIEVELSVFEDRETANKWIERKHSGQAGGIGPRSWTATQQARHYGEKTGNQLALALLEYAVEKKMITKQQSEGVITTVTRFVATPYVRTHGLGIVTSASTAEFQIQGTQSLFEKRLKQFMSDIVDTLHVNGATSRANSADRAKYAQDHLTTITEDTDETENDANGDGAKGAGSGTGATGTDGGSGAGGDGAPTQEGGTAGASGGSSKPVHPNNRQLLVPETFTPSVRDAQLKRILAELKLASKRSPIASALMVRVFVESITVVYLETRLGNVLSREDKLHRLVHKVLGDIEAGVKGGQVLLSKKEASALQLLKNQVAQVGYVYSAAYLGMVAHGTAFPEWATLTSRWDEIEAILNYIAVNSEPPIAVT